MNPSSGKAHTETLMISPALDPAQRACSLHTRVHTQLLRIPNSRSILSLSPGIPVLPGMRELQQLGIILNCVTGRALVMGKPKQLEFTSKRHVTLDLCKDVECDIYSRDTTRLETKQKKHVQFCSMLEGPMSAAEWLNQ